MLEGLSPPAGPPLPMPEVKLGVDGCPKVGKDTQSPDDEGYHRARACKM